MGCWAWDLVYGVGAGNLLGGFDEAKQQRMQEIIQQVLGEFSKQFPLKYKVR